MYEVTSFHSTCTVRTRYEFTCLCFDRETKGKTLRLSLLPDKCLLVSERCARNYIYVLPLRRGLQLENISTAIWANAQA